MSTVKYKIYLMSLTENENMGTLFCKVYIYYTC